MSSSTVIEDLLASWYSSLGFYLDFCSEHTCITSANFCELQYYTPNESIDCFLVVFLQVDQSVWCVLSDKSSSCLYYLWILNLTLNNFSVMRSALWSLTASSKVEDTAWEFQIWIQDEGKIWWKPKKAFNYLCVHCCHLSWFSVCILWIFKQWFVSFRIWKIIEKTWIILLGWGRW